jgi:peptide/nickel transport system substrate-binding protein
MTTPSRRAAAMIAVLGLALMACGSSGHKSATPSTAASGSAAVASGSAPIATGSAPVATGSAAVASASAPASAAAGTPISGGDLVIDTATPPQNFDTNQTTDNESIWAYDQIAQTLYLNGPDGKSLVPGLATSYTLSADKLSWTFQLRPGVMFSNGTPMTSADVVFSITQALDPKSAWNFVDSAIQSVTADGPEAVVVTTKYPWAPTLADLALFSNAIIPNNFGGVTRDQFFQHPVGTGPFEFSQWVKGQYVKLVRNPHYWEAGKPYLNSVTFQSVSDANTRVVQLQGGSAQVIESAPYSLLSSLQSSGFQLGLFPSTRIDYVTMNEQFKPFSDVHVRQAVSYAIDRASIMKAVFFGHGTVADSPLMPSVSYYTPTAAVDGFDLAKAKQELAQSSYPNGGFSIDFIAGAGDPIQTSVAQIVQADLKPLGITVNIRSLDPSEVTAQEQSFHFGMRETYWTMDIVDPDEWVSFGFGGTAGGSFSNFTHYDDPAVDALIKQSETTFDSATRASIYTQIQTQVAQDAPMVWLGSSPYTYVYSKNLHGYTVYPEGNAHLEDAWLSK